MSYGVRVSFEPLREVSFGSILASYIDVGSATTGFIRMASFNNDTNKYLYVSFDGVNDHIRLAPNSFRLWDFTANQVKPNGFFFPENGIFQVKYDSSGTAPTSGSFWVEAVTAGGGR
jgi:hypothetical protein